MNEIKKMVGILKLIIIFTVPLLLESAEAGPADESPFPKLMDLSAQALVRNYTPEALAEMHMTTEARDAIEKARKKIEQLANDIDMTLRDRNLSSNIRERANLIRLLAQYLPLTVNLPRPPEDARTYASYILRIYENAMAVSYHNGIPYLDSLVNVQAAALKAFGVERDLQVIAKKLRVLAQRVPFVQTARSTHQKSIRQMLTQPPKEDLVAKINRYAQLTEDIIARIRVLNAQ